MSIIAHMTWVGTPERQNTAFLYSYSNMHIPLITNLYISVFQCSSVLIVGIIGVILEHL